MIPQALEKRIRKLGQNHSEVYALRSRKCILSKKELNLKKVPWYEHAYFVDEKFQNKEDYFVFDPVSLVPVLALNPKKEKILDMCAAPGTKTYIISFITNNEAHIVSNDISRFRIKRLAHIINKFQISAEIRNISGRLIEDNFDKILLDAPCSGEGMVNKKEKVFLHWSEHKVKTLSKKQKKLARHAFEILNDNGVLVYSTCALSPEENEGIVQHILDNFDAAEVERININNLKHDKGITAWNNDKFSAQMKNCIRIWPQQNQTAGFFIARIRKNKN